MCQVVHKEEISFQVVYELPLPLSKADKKAAIERLDEFSQFDQDVRDREAYESFFTKLEQIHFFIRSTSILVQKRTCIFSDRHLNFYVCANRLENELEAYLYSIRDKLEDEYVAKASTEEDREAILAKVAEYVDWMESTRIF